MKTLKFKDLQVGQTFQFALKKYAGKTFEITKVDADRICYKSDTSEKDACISTTTFTEFLDRDVILVLVSKNKGATQGIFFQVSIGNTEHETIIWSFRDQPKQDEYINKEGYTYIINRIIHFPDTKRLTLLILTEGIKTGVH